MPPEDTEQSSLGALAISPVQIQANRYELISRVADGVAHEVKNPIHAALINLEVLRRRPDETNLEQLGRIDLLEEQVTGVHDLVDAFFRFLRPSPDLCRWIDIDDAIEALMPLLRAYCHVARVDLVYESAGGAICAITKTALQQIVLNLVVNAVEAMRPGGGQVTIQTLPLGEEVHLRISDIGPGFSQSITSRLAEPGGTTRQGRSGLGLAVCRHLAEEVGGRFEVESPEHGTHLLVALLRAADG